MKLRKVLCGLICMSLIMGISGCGSDGGANGRTPNGQNGVEDVLQAGMAEADAAASSGEEDVSNDEIRQSGLSDNAPKPDVTKGDHTYCILRDAKLV